MCSFSRTSLGAGASPVVVVVIGAVLGFVVVVVVGDVLGFVVVVVDVDVLVLVVVDAFPALTFALDAAVCA